MESKRTVTSPYLYGMTKYEAEEYIKHLPGLTERERMELMAAAEHCPNTKGRAQGRLPENAKQRIEELKAYLKEHPFATHADITRYFRMNGNNLYYILNLALSMNVVDRVRVGRKYIYTAGQ